MLICQVTDLHTCQPGRRAYGTVDTNAMADRALAAIAGFVPRPEALLITGDLAEDGTEAAYQQLLAKLLRHLSIPVYAIPGNHDKRDPMRQALGTLPGLSSCRSAFLHYVVDNLPVRLVMLDTLVPGEDYGELCQERLNFLEQSLAAAPDRPTVIVMHHPPFSSGIEFMDQVGLRNASDFAAIVARHKQVERVLCGHVHRTVLGCIAHVPVLIAPSPCHQVALTLAPGAPGAYVLDPPAFAVHRWTARDGFSTHIAFVGPTPGPFPFSAR